MAGRETELERMVVRLTGDGSSYKAMMKEAQSITRQASKAIGMSVSRIGGALKSAAAEAANIGASIAAAGGIGGAGAAVGFGVKLAAEAEQTRIAFETMLGSASNAKKMMADLTAFAASTPFELPGITDAAKKLLAYGIEQQNIIPTMTRLGDIAAGLGIPLGELSDIYGKARTQGTLFAEDINQLTGRGIPIIKEFAKQMGVTESEVKKLASEGKINFGHLQQAFADMTGAGGQFGGLMEKQSQSLAGKWSTMKDEISQTLQALGVEIIETFDLKTVVSNMTEFFGKVRGQVKEIVGWVVALDQGIDDLALRAAAWVKGIDAGPIIKQRNQLREMTEDAKHLKKAMQEALGSHARPEIAADIKTVWNESNFDTSGFEIDLSGMNLKPLDDKQREKMLARVREVNKETEAAAKEAAKLQEQHTKAIADTVKALKEQVATYGMSRKELALYEAEQMGASEAQRSVIAALHDELAAKEAATEATEEAREAEKRFRDSLKAGAIDAVGAGFDALARIEEFRNMRAAGRNTGAAQNPAIAPAVVAKSNFNPAALLNDPAFVGNVNANANKLERLLANIAETNQTIAEKEPIQIKSAGIGGS